MGFTALIRFRFDEVKMTNARFAFTTSYVLSWKPAIGTNLNRFQPKVFGVKFSLREIGRSFSLKYAISSFLKCLNYKV